MNPEEDKDLLWIAKEGIKADVPSPWIQLENDEGKAFFYNTETKDSTWVHPLDVYYKRLYNIEKAKRYNNIIEEKSYRTNLPKNISNERGKVLIKII